jgi:predicted RecB family nuclease
MGKAWDWAMSGSKIRQYVVCERLPYMEAYADDEDAIEHPARNVVVQIGVEHEARVGRVLRDRAKADIPAPPPEMNATETAKWTLEQMRKGMARIAGGVLRDKHGHWWGAPDWLVKHDGKSRFGRWHYEVEDAKAGGKKRSPRYHTLPVAYYSLLLERIQGRRPVHFTLHRFDGVQQMKTDDYEEQVHQVIEPIEWIVGEARDPGPHLNSECSKCPWEKVCRRDANGAKDLSLITGIRRTTRHKLKALKIHGVHELAKQAPETIAHLPYLRAPNAANRAVEQAKSYLDGIPRVAGTPALPAPGRTELFIDFEGLGENNRADAFMFGVIARHRGRTSYQSFVAETRRGFRRPWNAFVAALRRYPPDAPIYHYGNYEWQILLGMGRSEDLASIGPRMVDLMPVVRSHAAVPRYGFGLKIVAEAIGFRWRDENADGWLARIWWEGALRTGGAGPLRRLRAYNSDDLRATLLLRDWLVSVPRKVPSLRPIRALAARTMKTAGRRA